VSSATTVRTIQQKANYMGKLEGKTALITLVEENRVLKGQRGAASGWPTTSADASPPKADDAGDGS
jgi:hypothetical protein